MTWRTRLSIEACKARLAAGIDVERLWFTRSGYRGERPILGKIRDTRFRLQKRRYYRNSFAPFFYGRFVDSGGSTLIEGEFRMHPFVKVFMGLWLSFIALFSVLALASSTRPGEQEGKGIALVFSAGMMVFGIALIKFGHWLARAEKPAIVAFLKTTLEAEDALVSPT